MAKGNQQRRVKAPWGPLPSLDLKGQRKEPDLDVGDATGLGL